MSVRLNKYNIYKFSCCNEGRTLIGNGKNSDGVSVGNSPFHYFIIISPQEYSEKQHNGYVSAIPLSHSAESQTKQTYSITLDSDDFSGADPDLRRSFILCDRPMRLFKNNVLEDVKSYGAITYKALQKVISKIAKNYGVNQIVPV